MIHWIRNHNRHSQERKESVNEEVRDGGSLPFPPVDLPRP